MKAPAFAVLLICLLFCCCYQRTTIEPASVQIVSPFKTSSLVSWGPAAFMISLRDAEQTMLDVMPDPATASLTSSKGVRYPVRFLADQVFYDASSGPDERELAKKLKDPTIGYCFDVLRPDQSGQRLDRMPDGAYHFSIVFTGPSGAKNFSATFKRSSRMETVQIDH